MHNPITGEYEIKIAGKKYILRFDWDAITQIEKRYGQSPNLFSPEILPGVAAVGMQRRHPDMTEERIKEISPPLVPLAMAVDKSLRWAYFGDEDVPDPDKKKANLVSRIKTGLSSILHTLSGRG